MKITTKERLMFYPGFFLIYPIIHYLIQKLSGEAYYDTWFELFKQSLGTVILIGIFDFVYQKFWYNRKPRKGT